MTEKVAIIGGGAAGFFAAIACAEANPNREITIYERGSQFLSKVRISGGGRCNVTHACFEPRPLSESYPRGERALISPLHRFGPNETVAWFRSRGVNLKTEDDGRMFPVTDNSMTIVSCLIDEARLAGVKMHSRKSLETARALPPGGFELAFANESLTADRLLLAMGGCRAAGSIEIVKAVGHEVVPPVPSLFSLHLEESWLKSLPGIAVAEVEVSAPENSLRERGPLLITHNGVSGPAILRLSAWGARILHDRDYRFALRINWLPDITEEMIRGEFQAARGSNPNRLIVNSPPGKLPARLWEQLAFQSGVRSDTKWTTLSREQGNALVQNLRASRFEVNGKSLNKDEFVTCGGVKLREVDLKTMESRITPHLYFAGELLDIDGITGGFNFQAAWTTGWIAGNAMAAK